MFNGWKKVVIRPELSEKVSLYTFEKEFFLVRHFPFGFAALTVKAAAPLLDGSLEELPENIRAYIYKGVPASGKKGRVLRRLNLIVSQVCNCRCSYCYAGDGGYGGVGFMAARTMKDAIDRALDYYDKVVSIQFFGGEPLLAPALIEEGIIYAEKGASERKKPLPAFSVVTNLTVLPDNILELVKRGKLSILTSLDGPKEVHDHNRVFSGGAPTYDTVTGNIRRLAPYSQPRTVEATYTGRHRALGIGPMEVKKHILSLCPGAAVVVVPQLGMDESAAARVAHAELAEIWSAGADPASPLVKASVRRYLRLLKAKERREYFCDLGRENFTVDASGRVWPCQVFCGKGAPLGRIEDDWDTLRGRFAGNPAARNKASLPNCAACFLQEYCTSCPGTWRSNGGSLEPSKKQCETDRGAYLTAFLLAFRAQKGTNK